jgi:hypothetical protein
MDLNVLENSGYNPITNTLKKNKMILIILTIVIIIYYVVFSSFTGIESINSNDVSSSGLGILELLLWGLLVFLILITGLKYFLNIDIKASIRDILSDEPEIDLTVIQDKLDEEIVEELKEEVFHVSKNKYTYDDADAVCKAFGSRLATYDEVERSYNAGGEWCSYGWTKDQLALYPTQKKTYEKLQKKKGYENSCGRPGINGGFIANPNVRFGVNCYGYKPKITNAEKLKMQKINEEPKTPKEIEFEKKVNEYKNNLSSILLNPFNNKKWSRIN